MLQRRVTSKSFNATAPLYPFKDIVLSASKPDEELDEEPFAELIDDETREAKGEPATCALKEKVTLRELYHIV